MMIGLGVAASSGLLNEEMKKLAKVPEQWLVFLIVFVGISGNIAPGRHRLQIIINYKYLCY